MSAISILCLGSAGPRISNASTRRGIYEPPRAWQSPRRQRQPLWRCYPGPGDSLHFTCQATKQPSAPKCGPRPASASHREQKPRSDDSSILSRSVPGFGRERVPTQERISRPTGDMANYGNRSAQPRASQDSPESSLPLTATGKTWRTIETDTKTSKGQGVRMKRLSLGCQCH